MTVHMLAQRLGLCQVAGGEKNLNTPVLGCYAGDLLSWVMHKASAGNAWITVMGGINSIAVAVMDDLSCILLAEDSSLDQEAKERADKEGVPVFSSSLTTVALAVKISLLLEEEKSVK